MAKQKPTPPEIEPVAAPAVPTLECTYHGFKVTSVCHEGKDWEFVAHLPSGSRTFATLAHAVAAAKAEKRGSSKGGER